MEEKIPLVSVIIPMYNAAKFIPQTLESLLYQTMTDFEVIIIDDCSTDNGVEVVKNYAKKFDGRLRLIKLSKNTGMPGLPRNEGIKAARGKYIAFLDSDDLFTKNALEDLSTLAEQFQADVVRVHNFFSLFEGKETEVDNPVLTNMSELTNPKNFTLISYSDLTKPFLERNDIGERVKTWTTSKNLHFWRTCLFFYRREFIIDNKIFFPAMLIGSDMFFAFEALCLAKNYLNVPNITYIIRPLLGSVSRDKSLIDLELHMHKRVSCLKIGFDEFERIMARVPYFAERPEERYAVFDWFGKIRINWMKNTYQDYSAHELSEFVKREFHPDDATLAAYLFDLSNISFLKIRELEAENKKLRTENKKLKTENQKLKRKI